MSLQPDSGGSDPKVMSTEAVPPPAEKRVTFNVKEKEEKCDDDNNKLMPHATAVAIANATTTTTLDDHHNHDRCAPGFGRPGACS